MCSGALRVTVWGFVHDFVKTIHYLFYQVVLSSYFYLLYVRLVYAYAFFCARLRMLSARIDSFVNSLSAGSERMPYPGGVGDHTTRSAFALAVYTLRQTFRGGRRKNERANTGHKSDRRN